MPIIDISHFNWNEFVMLQRVIIGVVMVSMLASSVVDRRFEPRSSQTKDYKIGIYCFSNNYAWSIKEKEQRLVGSESG